MRIVSIKEELLSLYAEDTELMQKEGRPCVLVIKLRYKGQKVDFAVPLRSNIPHGAAKDEYFSLPPRSSTRKHNRHGIHYIKMFPITSDYWQVYRIGDVMRSTLDIIDRNESKIVSACQRYLDKYERGFRPMYSTDLDLLIKILHDSKHPC